MYSVPQAEVIRTALHHAIDERESLAQAYDGLYARLLVENDRERARLVEDIKRQIADFRLMLKRRYNESH